MADVYKGRDQMLNRYVAIKVLKKQYKEDENFVRKFRSEAQAAAGLMHPNIVNVYDVGEDRGLNYMVMELVEGITLKEYIERKGRLSHKETISIAIQMCSGIGAAHASGIIHRDIKPQNIIISKDGKVKVTDFGIAKAVTSNTVSTNAMGSVHYTSPEQARGGFSDQRSDSRQSSTVLPPSTSSSTLRRKEIGTLGPTALRTSSMTIRQKRARFSADPPNSSVRSFVVGDKNWLIRYPCPACTSTASKPASRAKLTACP